MTKLACTVGSQHTGLVAATLGGLSRITGPRVRLLRCANLLARHGTVAGR